MTKDKSEYLIERYDNVYEVVIGLEVHAQVTSSSKLFSIRILMIEMVILLMPNGSPEPEIFFFAEKKPKIASIFWANVNTTLKSTFLIVRKTLYWLLKAFTTSSGKPNFFA